jgi:hypothetical protein
MVYRPLPWYIDNLTHGISTPTHGILTPYLWYKDPLTHGILTPYQWYMEPPTHGISILLPMVFWPPIHGIKTHLPMVFWPPINGIWSPIPMVYRPTTYGILTLYQWYIDHPTHGILTSYPWYIDPPTHGILTPYPWYFDPLSMIFWPPAYLLIRNEGVKITWGFNLPYRGVWFQKGGQYTIRHRSFLHSWPITGFVIRLTRRVPLVEQVQLTFPEHPSSVPIFSRVCVTRSLVLCVCFVDHCLSFCPFLPLCCPSFDLRILISPFGFGILKLLLRKAVIHFPIGSYVKNCHVSGS